MGNQNNTSKDNDLYKMVNKSNPIMMTEKKNRPCKIEGGKIILNFNNYNEEYNSLNKHLETLKNKMNIVLTNDIIELIQKKLEDLNKITLNEDIQNAINSFYSTYKSNLQNYYSYISEIKKVYKDSYLEVSEFLVTWLKQQKNMELDEENSKVDAQIKKMNDVLNKFGKFSEIKDLVNKICYFKIDYASKDKYSLMDKYFNENKQEFEKDYKFENISQFRSLINLRDLIIDNILQKNSFAEGLEEFHKEFLSFYKVIIKQINSHSLDKAEIINEFNEYNSVIIYHRLIRSIEEKIKLIKLD